MTITNSKKMSIGYRNNEFINCGTDNFKKVVTYEIVEANNVDIIDTLKNLYGINAVSHLGDYDTVLGLLNNGKLPKRDSESIVENILECMYEHFKTNSLYAVWVCETIKDVKEHYTDDFTESISKIHFHENNLVISDLEDEGFLVVTVNYEIFEQDLLNI